MFRYAPFLLLCCPLLLLLLKRCGCILVLSQETALHVPLSTTSSRCLTAGLPWAPCHVLPHRGPTLSDPLHVHEPQPIIFERWLTVAPKMHFQGALAYVNGTERRTPRPLVDQQAVFFSVQKRVHGLNYQGGFLAYGMLFISRPLAAQEQD